MMCGQAPRYSIDMGCPLLYDFRNNCIHGRLDSVFPDGATNL